MNDTYGLKTVLRRRPQAEATVRGGEDYPEIFGKVMFYQLRYGVIVRAQITGLPRGSVPCGSPFFAFHIHEGGSCGKSPFTASLGHYNPASCLHPYHAGDMPPLEGADGRALSVFLTNRFTVEEIIGRTVIIHSGPDDFKTQPSGNSGEKIACGVINRL